MTISETYADLGGGLTAPVQNWTRVSIDTGGTDVPPVSNETPHVHAFHAGSGWCGCGARDTGEVAEGSIAWRAAKATNV